LNLAVSCCITPAWQTNPEKTMADKIRTALISVSDKTGIVEFAKSLAEFDIHILSTGGTAKTLRDAGLEVTDISDHTGFPEIMDGRVKTLHPRIHGGILSKRNEKSHQLAMKEHDITPIDMVVINLYPFEETVKSGAKFDECIEQIDIGGPALIRSAAKNHQDVTIIVGPESYMKVSEDMKANNGATSKDLRQKLAANAFARTAGYDASISTWFSAQRDDTLPEVFNLSVKLKKTLRYGENPHQPAGLFTEDSGQPGVSTAEQIQGKELSYNNIADTDAALDLVSEFSEPTAAIIKHTNPSGVATADSLAVAYERALACDHVSSYGGIVAFNRSVDKETAEALYDLFLEVVIAPGAEDSARKIIAGKKNLRLLLTGEMPDPTRKTLSVKSVTGGLLVQERDYAVLNESELNIVTERRPTDQELADLKFAFTVAKHVKSNAIVLARNSATVGIGAGQMNRINSLHIAAKNATELNQSVKDASGSAMASEAFLPFADSIISAAEYGIKAIIQPGGSIRDEEIIQAADDNDIAMVFTGIRHFRH